jgi:hypothetical protein
LKLFHEWREGRIKESSGGDELKYDFVNATMYPHPAQQLNNKYCNLLVDGTEA